MASAQQNSQQRSQQHNQQPGQQPSISGQHGRALGPGNGNPQQPAEPQPQEETQGWDEERLGEAMKKLKEMHIQLRNLRTTIPRLIAPLTTKQASPEVLAASFSASARTAIQEVKDFRELMLDEENQKLLQQAKKSRAANPKDIKPWKVTDHPDWLTRDA